MDLQHHVKIAVGLLPIAAVCLAACSAPSAQAAARTLVVEAGDKPRAFVPMSVELPAGTANARMTDAGKDVSCQVAEGKLWFVLDKLAAGASKSYSVDLGAAGAGASKAVKVKQLAARIDVDVDGMPFTSYVFLPKTIGKAVLRRPYFFPVYGPGQVPMTRPYPMIQKDLPKNVATDHPHHTSIYVAHGAVNGVDNWSIGGRAGYIVHKGFEAVAGGAVMGMFRETLDWTTIDKKPVMAEVRTARVYRLPDTHRMLDLELTFAAKYGKVLFGDTKEGGLCATRMRPELRCDRKGEKGRLVNSEGEEAGGAWGKKARWVDCSGMVDGKRLGFAIFDAPGNLRHPTTWHARTYGLLTANPFGLSHFTRKKQRGDYTLADGKERTWRYRIFFHEGTEKQAKVDARWGDYAEPPKATWK